MSSSSERALRVPEEVLIATRKYLDRVVRKFNRKLKLAILYGSYARGDYTTDSDIDLLLVIDDLHELRPIDRLALLLDVVDSYVIEPHVYTPEEFLELVRQCRMTAYDALTQGVVLHADREYYSIVLEEFKHALEKYRPIRTYWFLKLDVKQW